MAVYIDLPAYDPCGRDGYVIIGHDVFYPDDLDLRLAGFLSQFVDLQGYGVGFGGDHDCIVVVFQGGSVGVGEHLDLVAFFRDAELFDKIGEVLLAGGVVGDVAVLFSGHVVGCDADVQYVVSGCLEGFLYISASA